MVYKKIITAISFFAFMQTATSLPTAQRISHLEQIITFHDLTTKTPLDVCKILNGYQETARLKKHTGTIITIGQNQYTKNNHGDWTLFNQDQTNSQVTSVPNAELAISPKHQTIIEQIKEHMEQNPNAHVLTLLNLNLPAPDKTEITIHGTTYKKARHGKWYQPDAKVYSLHPNSMPEVQSAKSLALTKKPVLSKKRTRQLEKLIAIHKLTEAKIEDTLDVLNGETTKLQAPNYTKITIDKHTYCKSFKGPWINIPSSRK